MNTLYLLRHGLTQGNLQRLYYGSSDLPLCSQGLAQLHAQKAAGGYPDVRGLLVITSGMLRTEQTLAAVYGETQHECWADLRELDFGAFELKGYEQLKDDADYQRWLNGTLPQNRIPGGESEEDHRKRVLRALKRLLAQPRDVLAVVHGGSITIIMQALFPQEGKNRYQWQPQPGCGYAIDLRGHRYRSIPE